MKKSTQFGCDQCPDYVPPEGKMIDGKLQCPGLANNQTMAGNGRCQKVFKMLRRLKACPRGGKA